VRTMQNQGCGLLGTRKHWTYWGHLITIVSQARDCGGSIKVIENPELLVK
jgi:hypothetical protein